MHLPDATVSIKPTAQILTCAIGSAFQQRYSRPAFMAPAAGKAVIGSNIPTFADRYRGDFSQRMPLYLLQFV